MNTFHKSWLPFILSIHPKFRKYINNIDSNTYFPEKENIYKVFEMSLYDIKVIILGQDPYPKINQSIGLAFAVSENTNKPASIKVIEKEIGYSVDKTLVSWTKQGIFLLNSALTVERYKSGSHLKLWSYFTTKLILYISNNVNVIWVLWGNQAQSYINNIKNSSFNKLEINKNIILTAAHPAAELYKNNAGFYNNNHFNIINDILKQKEYKLINW